MADRQEALAEAAKLFTKRRHAENAPPAHAVQAEEPPAPEQPQPQAVDARQQIIEDEAGTVEFDDSEFIPGLDPEDDLSDEPQEPAAEMYRVTVDGEEVEVSLDELRKGYSRHADYGRKTQALSEERKKLETQLQAAQEKEQQYDALLTHLHGEWNKVEVLTPEELASLYQTNPQQWAIEKERIRERQEQMSAVQAEQARIAQERQGKALEAMREFAAAEMEKLLQAYPEWKDPAVQEEAKTRLHDHAVKVLGFTSEEVKMTLDSRLVRLLADSEELHRIKSKDVKLRRGGTQQAKKVPSSAQNARGASRRRRARKRLAETGSVNDAQPVIKDILQRKRRANRS